MINTFIQKLLLVTSFLASLSSYYGYLVWSSRQRRAGLPAHRFPGGTENVSWATTFLTAAYSGKEDHSPTSGTSRKPSGPA